MTGTRHHSSIERVAVRNALNPVLWLCGLVSTPAAISVSLGNGTWLHIALALGPVAVALFAFCFFMFRDPDRLHSESFQLRKQALELIEEKGSLSVIDATTIEVISNPEPPALPSGDGTK